MILIETYAGKYSLDTSAKPEPGVLATLKGTFAEYGKVNANNRLYEKPLWDNVIRDPDLIRNLNNKTLFGELDHPVDHMDIDPNKPAICITSLVEDSATNTICGVAKVLDTPAGKILNTLLRFGSVLGMSSRGSGDVGPNGIVNPDTYKFITFDVVVNPSNVGAIPQVSESKASPMLSALIESTGNADKDGLKIIEKVSSTLDEKSAEVLINKVEERKSMLKEDGLEGDDSKESPTEDSKPSEDESPKADAMEAITSRLDGIAERLDKVIEILSQPIVNSTPVDTENEHSDELVTAPVGERVSRRVEVAKRLKESTSDGAVSVVKVSGIEESDQESTIARTAAIVRVAKSK